jgi:ribosomal protein S12 methylthiotransferase accessory factor YcaO
MIEWRHNPTAAYRAEQAIAGDFKLTVFDLPSGYLGPSEVIWEMFGPPGWQTLLATGKANRFDAAKAAAERALAELRKRA